MGAVKSTSLSGISQTLLWTLHNRASKSRFGRIFFRDPAAEKLYLQVPYEYELYFGKPDVSHVLWSHIFDRELRQWLKSHPSNQVIELGCGLETQYQRCGNGSVKWTCIDLPDVIALRRELLPESNRCRYLSADVKSGNWAHQLSTQQPVFISTQGLLMYFYPAEVKNLLSLIAAKFPNATILFDTIPPDFSKRTMNGYWKTKQYRVPPMPWGIARKNIEKTFWHWLPYANRGDVFPYTKVNHFVAKLLGFASKVPLIRNKLPYVVKVTVNSL